MSRNIIQFQITKGDKYYIASGVDVPVVTQAKTLDKLAKNIKEAASLYLADSRVAKKLGFSDRPSVVTNMEIPLYA
jgi:predicted RNase H-like HicB family nuclease